MPPQGDNAKRSFRPSPSVFGDDDGEDGGKGKGKGKENEKDKDGDKEKSGEKGKSSTNGDKGKSGGERDDGFKVLKPRRNDTSEERDSLGEPSREDIYNHIQLNHPSYMSVFLKGRREFPLSKFCKPENTCSAVGGPQLSKCVQNFMITPDMLDEEGAIAIRVDMQTFRAACRYHAKDGSDYDVYISYRLTASQPFPVPAPTAAPTLADKVYPVIEISMNVTGLDSSTVVTPDVATAFTSALRATLNVTEVPSLQDTQVVLITEPIIVIFDPTPLANLTVPPLITPNGTIVAFDDDGKVTGDDDGAKNVTANRKLATTSSDAYATVKMTVTMEAPLSASFKAQVRAVQGLVATFFPMNLNYTAQALGLGINLAVTSMASQSVVAASSSPGGAAPPPPTSTEENKKSQGDYSNNTVAIIGGVVGVVLVIALVAVYWGYRNRKTPLALDAVNDSAPGNQWKQQSIAQPSPTLPRTSNTQSRWDRDSNNNVTDDIPARLAPTSARGSTITSSVNPLIVKSAPGHDQL